MRHREDSPSPAYGAALLTRLGRTCPRQFKSDILRDRPEGVRLVAFGTRLESVLGRTCLRWPNPAPSASFTDGVIAGVNA
jgi:hypothetical protein